jgi:hypothetical protein
MTKKSGSKAVSAEQEADFREKQKQALARKLGRLVYAQVARRAAAMYLASLATGTPNELTTLYNRARRQLQNDFDEAIEQMQEIRQEWCQREMGRDPEEIGFAPANTAWLDKFLREQLDQALTGKSW